jgi:hypothetical protein
VYFGTHIELVVGVQVAPPLAPPALCGGRAQFVFGAHDGRGAGAVQSLTVCEKQTMPSAQSLSAVHGSGEHCLISVCAGQFTGGHV